MKQIFALLLVFLGSTFAISAAAASESTLPHYATVATDPADGATVRAVTTITVTLSSDDYDAPLGIMPGAAAPTATHTATDGTATPIDGLKAAVKGGLLTLTFAQPVTQPGDVTIHIPEGLTNNLAMPVAMMTPEEIIEEGGCTNPHLTLTFHIQPQLLPVRDVTGIGYNTTWLTDDAGNYLKDERGQYVRIDQYRSLIDAHIQPGTLDDDDVNNRITVIYFWYDEEFATIDYRGGASVRNVTTGTPMPISTVTFKQGGDHYRRNVIELRLSTTAYIYSPELHQGVYEVTLPSGIATTPDGTQNAGITFRFTFGNPDDAFHAADLDLDDFLGTYAIVTNLGETSTGETFTFAKDAEGEYTVERLWKSPLTIPLRSEGSAFYLSETHSSDGQSFTGLRGGDVEVYFQAEGSDRYLIIGDYVLTAADGTRRTGGGASFVLRTPQRPTAIHRPALRGDTSRRHDLSGRPSAGHTSGALIIEDGRKVLR